MSLSLNCLLVGDDPDQIFTVKISKTENVSILKKLIKEENSSSLGNVDPKNIDLWQVSILIDDFSKTELTNFDFSGHPKLSPPTKKLVAFFSDDVADDCLHVIAKAPEAIQTVAAPDSTRREDSEDERPLKRIRTVGESIESYFRSFPSGVPPSSAGKPAYFLSKIQKSSPKVHCNRPLELSNIPLALLHPAFGQFRDLAQKVTPSSQDNHASLALTELMVHQYPDEYDRQTAFHNFFLDHFSQQLHAGSITATKSRTDGHGFANPNSSPPFIHVITEVKNELTGNSTDPYFQVALLFKDYLKTFPSRIFSTTIFPAVGILVFGCYLQIIGVAVTTNGIQMQPLSPAFAFFADRYDEDHRLMVTRSLAALRELLLTFKEYYRSISGSINHVYKTGIRFNDVTDNTALPATRGYPYVTSYRLLTAPSVTNEFEYTSRPYSTKLLFLAKHNGDQLLIKFTRRYSEEVHLLLSDRGYAPKLLGFEILPGGWFMVIMESLQKSYQSLFTIAPIDRERYRGEIKRIIGCLHENGFVHGDLRSPNFMVSVDGDGVMLVDFDEAGREGTACYPPNLNTVDIIRPQSATDGALITQGDDLFMFRQLFNVNDTMATRSQIIPGLSHPMSLDTM